MENLQERLFFNPINEKNSHTIRMVITLSVLLVIFIDFLFFYFIFPLIKTFILYYTMIFFILIFPIDIIFFNTQNEKRRFFRKYSLYLTEQSFNLGFLLTPLDLMQDFML
jgi:hypothetical protein